MYVEVKVRRTFMVHYHTLGYLDGYFESRIDIRARRFQEEERFCGASAGSKVLSL